MAEGFDQAWLDARDRQKAAQAGQNGVGTTIPPTTEKRTKYRNTPVLVDLGPSGEVINGHLRLVWTFDSQKEAEFYKACVLRRAAGEIRELRLQEPFALKVYGVDGNPAIVGEYLADAVFYDAIHQRRRVCDVKSQGTKTALYLLKRKIVEAAYGIVIEEA